MTKKELENMFICNAKSKAKIVLPQWHLVVNTECSIIIAQHYFTTKHAYRMHGVM